MTRNWSIVARRDGLVVASTSFALTVKGPSRSAVRVSSCLNKSLAATFGESEDTAKKGPGGKLHVTYDIARQFAGYGEKAGATSSEFADRMIQHL